MRTAKRPARFVRKRNRDGLLQTPGKRIEVPRHLSSVTLKENYDIDVVLIGCGGTGSQMLTGLAQMHATIRALNHEALLTQDPAAACRCRGLRVTVYDPDVVTQFNVGRQLFYEADLGMNKALCLVSRVNMAYGTQWVAVPEEYLDQAGSTRSLSTQIVISCTDTAKSRRELHTYLWKHSQSLRTHYWLDCANLATVGQVVLGQPGRENEEQWPMNKEFDPAWARWKGQQRPQIRDENGGYDRFCVQDDCEIRLPCVTELFPDLMDENFDETNEPSCSMVDAQRKQSLFVNRMVSAYALDLLWELIREGSVDNQGCFFNLRTRTAQPVPLKVWPV